MIVGLAQLSPTVGDVDGNAELIRDALADARDRGARIVLFPELAVCGYPAGDLLLRGDFLDRCRRAVEAIAREAVGVVAAFGAPLERAGDVHNALVVAADGAVRAVYDKVELPHYGAFDEARHFGPGGGDVLVRVGDHVVGLTVCADLWIADGPAAVAARAGAELILNASASPFHPGKAAERHALLFQRARDLGCPVAYCNLWGGHDELVFDGGSMVVDHRGAVLARAGQFRDELLLCSIDLPAARGARLRDPRLRQPSGRDPLDRRAAMRAEPAAVALRRPPAAAGPVPAAPVADVLGPEAECWGALTTGIADHARRHGHPHALVALDGSLAASAVALLAGDALGSERLTCVAFPAGGADPAAVRELAGRLGCDLRVLPTDALTAPWPEALGGELEAELADGVAGRLRAAAVWALARRHGWLALSCVDKSALALGCWEADAELPEALAPVRDVSRTLLDRLVRWRTAGGTGAPLPDAMVTWAPAADPWQAAGLPPAEVVDPILLAYVDEDADAARLVQLGHDPALVRQIIARVEAAEPRRRHVPPGPRVSERALGLDRRMPLRHGFREAAVVAVPSSAQPAAARVTSTM